MVVTEKPSGGDAEVLIIEPNRSLTWRQSKCLIVFFAASLSAVSLYFIFAGAWLVAPFAGLELLVLVVGVYCQCRWSSRRERILIDKESVWFESNQKKDETIRFPKAWLKINLIKDLNNWYPSRLTIGAHGRYVEIGQFLAEQERQLLADRLQEAIG